MDLLVLSYCSWPAYIFRAAETLMTKQYCVCLLPGLYIISRWSVMWTVWMLFLRSKGYSNEFPKNDIHILNLTGDCYAAKIVKYQMYQQPKNSTSVSAFFCVWKTFLFSKPFFWGVPLPWDTVWCVCVVSTESWKHVHLKDKSKVRGDFWHDFH